MANPMLIDTKELGQILAQQCISIHECLLGHTPDTVSYHFLNNKEVALIVEGAITQPEKILLNNGYTNIAKSVRHSLNNILRAQLIPVIEQVFQSKVVDLLNDTNIQSGRMSLIVIFDEFENQLSISSQVNLSSYDPIKDAESA